MSLAFSGRRMQLCVRIIRTDRISSFIDTTRATALPATRLNRSICGLGAIAFRWWRPRAKSGLLANRLSSERLKEVAVGEGARRVILASCQKTGRSVKQCRGEAQWNPSK